MKRVETAPNFNKADTPTNTKVDTSKVALRTLTVIFLRNDKRNKIQSVR